MSVTVKLESVRFVKRVSSGASLSKYGYIGIMQSNAEALKTAPWAQASCLLEEVSLTTNQLSKTDGVFSDTDAAWTVKPSYTAYMSDTYDCFNQAGDAVARNATMCGYAGCVAYRFKLPTSETANPLEGISLALQRDRYLRAGVRIGMQLSDSETPSDSWSVVRGEATGCVRSTSTAATEGVVGVDSFGFLGQPDVPVMKASVAADGTATFDTATAFASAASYKYLYVYLTLEDPDGYWNLYRASEVRQYYIEGSAMLVANGCSFTFTNAVAASASASILITPSLETINGSSLGAILSSLSGSTISDYTSITSLDMLPQTIAGGDVMVLSQDGAPVVRMNGSGEGATMAYGLDGCTDSDSLMSLNAWPRDDSKKVQLAKEAVNAAYGAFYTDSMIRCPNILNGYVINRLIETTYACPAGASFGIVFAYDDRHQSLVAIYRKKLLVPFTVPKGFIPRTLRLSWKGYRLNGSDPSDQNPDVYIPECRHNVWLAANRDYAYGYSLSELQKHELFTAEATSIGEFRLLKSIVTSVDDTAKTFDIDMPSGLGCGPHTLLFTLFFDQNQFDYLKEGETGYDATTSILARGNIGMMCPSRPFCFRNIVGTLPTIPEGTPHVGGMLLCLPGGWSPQVEILS